jgi:hypothetical protein
VSSVIQPVTLTPSLDFCHFGASPGDRSLMGHQIRGRLEVNEFIGDFRAVGWAVAPKNVAAPPI